jgi:hypothetical protein
MTHTFPTVLADNADNAALSCIELLGHADQYVSSQHSLQLGEGMGEQPDSERLDLTTYAALRDADWRRWGPQAVVVASLLPWQRCSHHFDILEKADGTPTMHPFTIMIVPP